MSETQEFLTLFGPGAVAGLMLVGALQLVRLNFWPRFFAGLVFILFVSCSVVMWIKAGVEEEIAACSAAESADTQTGVPAASGACDEAGRALALPLANGFAALMVYILAMTSLGYIKRKQ